jgi:hypothetical protein
VSANRIFSVVSEDVLWYQGPCLPEGMILLFQFNDALCEGFFTGDCGMVYVAANADFTEGTAWIQQ